MKDYYGQSLGERFTTIAKKFENNNALIYPNKVKIKYGELNNLANKIFLFLQSAKLNDESLILISGDKSIMMFAVIIASLKSGHVYSVYNPDSPSKKLEEIFKVCNPDLVITSNSLHSLEDSFNYQVVSYMQLSREIQEYQEDVFPINKVVSSQLAYIMFTSGSTGTPKGVMITHDNVLKMIDWSISQFDFNHNDILTNVNPSYFDNFVFDFYSALFSGATLAVFDSDTVSNPKKLLDSVNALSCTSWFSVPSLLIYLQNIKALNQSYFSRINRIIFGGEGYPKVKLKNLFKLYEKRAKFYNVYGPTECTCISSCYQVERKDFESIDGYLPLGKIIPSLGYHILNQDLSQVEIGKQGELFLWGPAVGAGYCNNADYNKSSFIVDPYANNRFKRVMYKTGDVVYIDPRTEMINIIGRSDNQIKHMGYRIELEEIENSLMKLTYVLQSCCVHGLINDISHIVAVVVVKNDIEPKVITKQLKEYLPNYMIPSRVIIMNSLYKNANGKVDRVKIRDMVFSTD